MPRGLAYTGYILVLVGGVLMVVEGALGFLGIVTTAIFNTRVIDLGLGRDLFTLILGIVALFGSRYVRVFGWAIGLMIVGLVGGGLGGVLVLVGGILGLVSQQTRRR